MNMRIVLSTAQVLIKVVLPIVVFIWRLAKKNTQQKGEKRVMDDKLYALLDSDGALQQAIAALKEKQISLTDILKGGTLRSVIQRLAAAVIAVRDYYIEQPGDNVEDVDDLIKQIARYLDEKVELPIWVEPFDELMFKYIIGLAMSFIEGQAEDGAQQVAAYKAELNATNTAAKDEVTEEK